MRCKRHPCEPGSVGVCASCLRERLLALLAAQAKEAESANDHRKSDPPPPLIFPRSVSPYVCHRSVHDTWRHDHQQHHHLFYSTPQLGPTFANNNNKKKYGRFSLFSSLFGSSSRSEEIERDPRVSRPPITSSPLNSSPSWFSALLPRSRKKKSRLFSLDDDATGICGRRSCPAIDRGMSPSTEMKGNIRGEDEGYDSPTGSGYSSESSSGWRKSGPFITASRAPAPRRRGGPQHNRNVSGFAFCLSPLVRASPNNHRHRHDTGSLGEFRGANRPHMSTAASLCTNRSRKLTDFGRYP